MSHKRFTGWEPATVTEHEYDADGRLVRSVTRREAEWTDEERANVLALIDYEGQCCPGCGGYLPETTSAEHEGQYTTEPPMRCHACTAIHIKQHAFREQNQSAALVQWPVRLRQ